MNTVRTMLLDDHPRPEYLVRQTSETRNNKAAEDQGEKSGGRGFYIMIVFLSL